MTTPISSLLRHCAAALCLLFTTSGAWAVQASAQNANAERVQQAFTQWQQGSGTVFDLLAPDAVWTVAGSSPVSGVYHTKTDLMEQAVRPITARLATPIAPTVRSIIAEDDVVVVLWSGAATALDRKPYNNTYLWHLSFEDGKITRVTAFLDTYVLNDLMVRVKPGQ